MEAPAQACDLICRFFSAAAINNIILFCGVVATVMAIRSAKVATVETISHTREIAKQTETALFMFNSRSDRNLTDGYQTIRSIHSSDSDNIVSYATNDEKRKSPEAEKIRYALNFWERVAVCVSHGIYCEKIIKDSMYTTVTDVFQRAQPYINAVREQKHSQTPYQDFETMARRWLAEPLKSKHS
ncbi:DUF4760 domain-containing protein [Pseudomonas cichorii]|uniref:DUF4760 domain-containing protein n=1 Tax=Pseudomonas cichorii TaxID=36746 RepID=UPI00046D71D4|nr:DUF4760 domain-containing protein [Pseudomonas cichorii]QVE15714.1 DUF4760 domain-containing protein [Pseudomonas cichorii]SDN32520.1 protein of unknown function [Pseudomonas cichorii]